MQLGGQQPERQIEEAAYTNFSRLLLLMRHVDDEDLDAH